MTMGFGHTLAIIFTTYYALYFIMMAANKQQREGIVITNKKLDEMRKKKFKTIEEQKKFLDLKYPRKPKFKFQWGMVRRFMFNIGAFILMFYIIAIAFDKLGIYFQLWSALIYVTVFPIITTLILKKFNLQKKNELFTLMRWK